MLAGTNSRNECLTVATPTPNPSERPLTPENCAFTFIDHQSQMALGVNSIDDETLGTTSLASRKRSRRSTYRSYSRRFQKSITVRYSTKFSTSSRSTTTSIER